MTSLLLLTTATLLTPAMRLRNDTLQLDMGVVRDGIPVIERGMAHKVQQPFFTAASLPGGLEAWLPKTLLPASNQDHPASWKTVSHPHFLQAEAARRLAAGITAAWIVQLDEAAPLFRVGVRLTNQGSVPVPVEWFPAWAASWNLPAAPGTVRWWKPLSFRQTDDILTAGRTIRLFSRLHSSESGGANPYWIIRAGNQSLYFALDWCGGWEANIAADGTSLTFSVRLPPDETQLTLSPGQSITGPTLWIMPSSDPDETTARAAWLTCRAAIAAKLYPAPAPSFPLTYNNWYTTRFDVDAAFLQRQIQAMDPYAFDAFIVDAGWYECVGRWTPAPAKFKPGQFEQILESAKAKTPKVGIWTCPQFIKAPADKLPPEVDQPGEYEKFIDGHLLDLAGTDFTARLTEHVASLRKQYHADWWKYDQLLFTAKTRAGVMRNVVAFQNALLAVRLANPDLIIENCQSGGRMINEFTTLLTQSQWLKDGGNNGLAHARSNVESVLGSLGFLFPWVANRWTNNFDRMDQNDDELTRFYCRSAMPGTWGIVSDLAAISPHQQAVIIREIAHYRRLSPLKKDCLYDVYLPDNGADVAGITVYAADRRKAAILLYRWDRRGLFSHGVALKYLHKDLPYRVEDMDMKQTRDLPPGYFPETSLPLQWSENRLSALLFVEVIP